MKKLLSIELNPNRIFGLDILRAMAIIFVMIGHGQSLLPTQLHSINSLLYFDGVSIFFVLSGYLIGGILIKIVDKNGFNFPLLLNFWSRRWFRTLPNYFLILTLLLLYRAYVFTDFHLWDYINYFFFSQNLYTPHPHFFPEAWSLSIEEWFYLIAPILLIIILKTKLFSTKGSFLSLIFLLISFVIIYRIIQFNGLMHLSHDIWDLNFRKLVITRLDSIMFGVLGAFLQFYYPSFWIKGKKLKLITGIVLFILLRLLLETRIISSEGFFKYVISFSVVSIATLLLLPFLSTFKHNTSYFYKPLTYISLLSYSMYLINYSIVKKILIEGYLNKFALPIPDFITAFVYYAFFWGATIFISLVIYKYFEIPTTQLRDYKRRK